MKILFAIVCVLFILTVLVQQKNSSLGSMMGGDAGEEIAQTRRGAEKFLHRLSIVLSGFLLGGGVYFMIIA